MNKKMLLRAKILQIIVAFVFSVGLIFPTGTVVLADDTVPPTTQEEVAPADPAVPEAPVVDASAEPPVVDPSAEPPAVVVPANPSTEVPVVDVTVDPLAPVATVEAAAPVAEVTSEAATTAEVIIQAAEDNGVTLADANGDPLTLATEETASLLENGDPFFWNGSKWVGYTLTGTGCPNHVECHKADGTGGTKLPFQAAIDNAPANTMIYVAGSTNSSTPTVYAEDLIINTSNLSFMGINSVTINNQNNSNISGITNGYATVNKVSLSVNFGTTTRVFANNIFISTGANLVDAIALVLDGGKVELGTGSFYGNGSEVNQEIQIHKSVEIFGQGATNTTIFAGADGCGRNDDNCPNLLIIDPTNTSKVTIRDLKIDGKNDSSGAPIDSNIAIDVIGNGTDLDVYNTVIQNFYSGAIAFDGINTFNIHNNTIQNIKGGSSSSTDGIGIDVQNDSGTGSRLISDNIFTNTDIGINFYNSQLNISGNRLNANSIGIRGEDGSATITNNSIYSNTTYGVDIVDLDDNGTAADDSVVLTDNRFFNNTSYGLYYGSGSSSDPTINAENNWWGCNSGPWTTSSVTGCERRSSTRIDSDPWLMLGLTANPTSIYTSQTSTLSQFMYSNRTGTKVTGLSWFNPLPAIIKTGTSLGNLVGDIFTAGLVAGIQNFSTTFDNGTATAAVQINAVPIVGCMDPTAFNYDPTANVPGPCIPKVTGCMDPTAFNYNPSANVAGPCTPKVTGCMDPTAFNYDPTANVAGPCTPKVTGCMDPTAFNYDPTANVAGPCTPKVTGCMDPTAFNYDPTANVAGPCTPKVTGCMDPTAFNYDPTANVAGPCTPKVTGCMDPTAFNYDPTANVAGPCTPKVTGCMDPTALNYDPAANVTGPCTPKVTGCMDPTAFNYDPAANVAGPCTAKVVGCMDPSATNYNPAANIADYCSPKPFTILVPPLVLPVGGLTDTGLIPITGGLNDLSCSVANTLALPNGDKVIFSDVLCDFQAALTQEYSESLISPLPTGLKFVDGFNLDVQKKSTLFTVLPQPVVNTLSFVVPDAYKGKTLKIMFWDTTFNKGLGGWIELPVKLMANGEVVTAPLSLGDERVVVSGVEMTTLPTSETTLNFTGLFILAAE